MLSKYISSVKICKTGQKIVFKFSKQIYLRGKKWGKKCQKELA